jgi:hypothetical protein
MSNKQTHAQHEITIPLTPGQTALVFSPRDVVDDLPANLVVGYYPGEDVPGGFPYKIALAPSLQTLFEASLSEAQFVQMLRHLAGWFKKKATLPHSVSDQAVQSEP